MDLPTLATTLPTAISATVYVIVQSSFLWTMARRRPTPPPAARPWVSILKPVAGADDELRENLESFAALDYPAFELLLGAASPDDPAVPIIWAFLAAHPELKARLVWTTPPRGEIKNPKVAQLIDLTRAARGSVIVVSDANVRVSPGYLSSLVSCLLHPGVGIVSSVVRGSGEHTLGAALENAQLGAAIAPAVVAAHRLFGRPITVGKSMAMRRVDLDRVGGWESVAGVLAEDDVLGQRFHDLGYGVELCLDPVENRNVSCSARRTVERHTRWAKMRRALVPRLFHFEPLLQPFVVALAAAVAAPSALAVRAATLALAMQIAFATAGHVIVGARRPLLLGAMEPLRILTALGCHLLAIASMRVSWRGNAFLLAQGSRLLPLPVVAASGLRRRLSSPRREDVTPA